VPPLSKYPTWQTHIYAAPSFAGTLNVLVVQVVHRLALLHVTHCLLQASHGVILYIGRLISRHRSSHWDRRTHWSWGYAACPGRSWDSSSWMWCMSGMKNRTLRYTHLDTLALLQTAIEVPVKAEALLSSVGEHQHSFVTRVTAITALGVRAGLAVLVTAWFLNQKSYAGKSSGLNRRIHLGKHTFGTWGYAYYPMHNLCMNHHLGTRNKAKDKLKIIEEWYLCNWHPQCRSSLTDKGSCSPKRGCGTTYHCM
jgi:hypothetical protein